MANVLIVDDRPTNRRLLVTLLGYEGHQVIEAADGAEALPIALRERPDLIVTDIVMPTMDGVEFIRQLRAALGSDLPPVIFYSATYLEREARALAQASGVGYVVTKPTTREEFLRVVRVALSSKKPFDAKEPERETFATSQVLAETLVDETKQLERVTFRLTSLIESGLELAAERDAKRLLAKCVHAGREIIGAKYARIGVLGNDGHKVHYLLTSGMDPRIAEKLGPPRHLRRNHIEVGKEPIALAKRQKIWLAPVEDASGKVDRVSRVRDKDDIAGVHHCGRKVCYSLLRTQERANLVYVI